MTRPGNLTQDQTVNLSPPKTSPHPYCCLEVDGRERFKGCTDMTRSLKCENNFILLGSGTLIELSHPKNGKCEQKGHIMI